MPTKAKVSVTVAAALLAVGTQNAAAQTQDVLAGGIIVRTTALVIAGEAKVMHTAGLLLVVAGPGPNGYAPGRAIHLRPTGGHLASLTDSTLQNGVGHPDLVISTGADGMAARITWFMFTVSSGQLLACAPEPCEPKTPILTVQ